MAKDINLTSNLWVDIIFEGKNKNYGAYALRKNSPQRHTSAFLIVMAAAVLIILSSIALNRYNKAKTGRISQTETIEIDNYDLVKPEDKEIEEPKVFKTPPPVEFITTMQFTVPTIKKDDLVKQEQEIKSQTELMSSPAPISVYDVKGTDENNGVDKATLDNNNAVTNVQQQEEKIFDVPEISPSFPGGEAALMEFLSNNLKYPVIAQENGVKGKVVVQFIVDKDGSIQNVTVVRSVDASLDKEAERVIKSMPKWIPGKQGGNAVKARFTVPVQFILK